MISKFKAQEKRCSNQFHDPSCSVLASDLIVVDGQISLPLGL